MATINVTNFSPMIEVNVKVFLQLPPNLDATASADDLEKVAATLAASHCAQAQEEKAPHTAFKVVRDEVKEKVVEKSADKQVEAPNNEPSQEDGPEIKLEPRKDGPEIKLEPRKDGPEIKLEPRKDGPEIKLEPSKKGDLEGVKAAIVGGNWTIDPQVVVQLLDGETLKQVLVKALTS